MGSVQSMGEEAFRCDELLECRELTEGDCCECYTGMERHKRLVWTPGLSQGSTPRDQVLALPMQSSGCNPSSHFGTQQPLQPRTFQRHQSLLRPMMPRPPKPLYQSPSPGWGLLHQSGRVEQPLNHDTGLMVAASIAAPAPPSRQATRNRFSPATPRGSIAAPAPPSRQATRNRFSTATSASQIHSPTSGATTAFATPPHDRAPGTRGLAWTPDSVAKLVPPRACGQPAANPSVPVFGAGGNAFGRGGVGQQQTAAPALGALTRVGCGEAATPTSMLAAFEKQLATPPGTVGSGKLPTPTRNFTANKENHQWSGNSNAHQPPRTISPPVPRFNLRLARD